MEWFSSVGCWSLADEHGLNMVLINVRLVFAGEGIVSFRRLTIVLSGNFSEQRLFKNSCVFFTFYRMKQIVCLGIGQA